MENKSHALAAGLFVLIVLGMLGGLAAWLTQDQASYETYELTTKQAVTGLQVEAAVRYKGVTVGKVEGMGFDPDTIGNVLIHIGIDRTAPLTTTTYAQLRYQGVTGLAHIELDDAPKPLPDLGESPRGYPRLALRPSNLSMLVDRGPEVIGEIQKLVANANLLLSEENQRILAAAIEGLAEAARHTTALVQKLDASWSAHLEPAMVRLGEAGDSSMQTMQAAAASLDTMSRTITRAVQRLDGPEGAISEITAAARRFADIAGELDGATLPGLTRTLDDVGDAARGVGSLTRELSTNPQALFYGPNASPPGPGEPGYVPPALPAPSR